MLLLGYRSLSALKFNLVGIHIITILWCYNKFVQIYVYNDRLHVICDCKRTRCCPIVQWIFQIFPECDNCSHESIFHHILRMVQRFFLCWWWIQSDLPGMHFSQRFLWFSLHCWCRYLSHILFLHGHHDSQLCSLDHLTVSMWPEWHQQKWLHEWWFF